MDESLDWTQQRDSISRLVQTVYDQDYGILVYETSQELKISSPEYLALKDENGSNATTTTFRISYKSKSEFISIMSHFGLMEDTKAGVPRSAYHGIVQFKWLKKFLIFVAPILDISSQIYKTLE